MEQSNVNLNPNGWVKVEYAMPLSRRQETAQTLAYHFSCAPFFKFVMALFFLVSLIAPAAFWSTSTVGRFFGLVVAGAILLAILVASTSQAFTTISKENHEITTIQMAMGRKQIRQLPLADVDRVGVAITKPSYSKMTRYRVVIWPKPGAEGLPVIAVVTNSAGSAQAEGERIAEFCGVSFDAALE